MNAGRAVWLSLLLLAACSRIEPLERPITAANDLDYHAWQKDHFVTLRPEDRELYQRAVQEIRYFVMTEMPGLSAAEQNRQLLSQLDGLKPRTVIAQGLLFANARMEPELAHDRGVLERNRFLLEKTPNTDEQVQTLRQAIDSIELRIARAEEKIRQNEELIRRFDPAASIQRPPPPAASPSST